MENTSGIPKERGVKESGIPNAWGGGVEHFGISERMGGGGVKFQCHRWKGYGYFLELPIHFSWFRRKGRDGWLSNLYAFHTFFYSLLTFSALNTSNDMWLNSPVSVYRFLVNRLQELCFSPQINCCVRSLLYSHYQTTLSFLAYNE